MTILRPWPEHRNPGEHIASAPYNFVPLPEMIIPAVSDAHELPDHDRYYPEPDYHSGYFDVTLTTLSPLYIRGPIAAKDLSHQEEKEVKDNPAFFHTGDETSPVIPGSSLRGMLRALLEIVSYSKMKWVSEKQFFFRTVDTTAIGKYYRSTIGGHIETGFLIRQNDKYKIKVCSMARVRRPKLKGHIYDGNPPNLLPRWQGQPRQYAPIWVRLRPQTSITQGPNIVEELSYQKRDGMVEGRLVITGDVKGKKKEFVFLLPAASAEEIPVSDEIISRFHDDDQLTQWQKEAFPANQPIPGYRERDGMLGNAPAAPGDPIFFLRENRKLTFIGRAQMFRLPYTRSPFDLVDQSLRSTTDIDYAEALFGFVRTPLELKELGANAPRQGEKGRAYAGRVTVTDAVLQPDQESIWLAGDFNKEITPKILATPKPTAFQHYLTQQHPDNPRRLDHYDSKPPESDETTIRGHKLYWHQGLGTDQGLTPEKIRDAIREPAKVGPGDTQHTRFKPLRPGVQFSFRVYFENLSDRELGALCWTLHPNGEPDRRYCHHLGMGKPLGMGAVELHARLHLINRSLRYEKLFNDSSDNWQLGEDLAAPDVLTRLTHNFEEHLLQELNPYPACKRLADMQRIAMLLKLLEWPGYLAEKEGDLYLEAEARPNTRYMTIQPVNEYRDRPVLPDPTLFDVPYFANKSRPQDTPTYQLPARRIAQPVRPEQQDGKSEASLHAATVEQAPAKKSGEQPILPPALAKVFYIGNELRGLSNFTRGEQGVEVRFWQHNPAQIIGFIPIELVDRPLGQKISVIITRLHQEPGGRIVVELKLRPRR
jgi:CRISPR-associated protein (TIGR03986 family)